MPPAHVCPCGKPAQGKPGGRPPRYCGEACRRQAKAAQRVDSKRRHNHATMAATERDAVEWLNARAW